MRRPDYSYTHPSYSGRYVAARNGKSPEPNLNLTGEVNISQVSVFWIIPIYVLTGASEIFAFLSSIEFAYTKAPPSMKSIISSINPLSCSIGNALGFALSPTSVQSKVKVEFAALSGTMFLATIVFYVIFSKYNKEEEEMNRLERNGVTDSNGTGNQTTDV